MTPTPPDSGSLTVAPVAGERPSLLLAWRPMLLAIMLVGAPLYWGAWNGFPFYDDGWLSIAGREVPLDLISSTMPDRPLFGVTLALVCRAFPRSPAAYVAIDAILWALLALQAGLLWRRLCPDAPQLAGLACAMTLAPVVVQAQMCTLLVALPNVLPTVVAFASLLLVLYALPREAWVWYSALAVAVALVVGGVFFSEYAIAALAAALLILAGLFQRASDARARWRLITAGMLLGSAALSTYVIFLQFVRLELVRPSVSPQAVGNVVNKSLVAVALNLANGLWYCVVTAYGRAFAGISVQWDSKSTVLGLIYGVLTGLALCWSTGAWKNRRLRVRTPDIHPLFLFLAVAAGLAPVVLMGRGAALPSFGSRFLIPVIPVAVAVTILLALRFVKTRLAWIAVAALGLICGNSAVSAAADAWRASQMIASLSPVLLPLVAPQVGMTVAVFSEPGMDYELTARVTRDWPVDATRKFWMYDSDLGQSTFGDRTACRLPVDFNKDLRLVRRAGPVHSLLWVEVRDGSVHSIQPYCLSTAPN